MPTHPHQVEASETAVDLLSWWRGSTTVVDRRANPRVGGAVTVEVFVNGKETNALCTSLGAGGLYLAEDEALGSGDLFAGRFEITPGNMVRFFGDVVRRGGNYEIAGWGIRFVSLSAEHRRSIEAMVRHRRP